MGERELKVDLFSELSILNSHLVNLINKFVACDSSCSRREKLLQLAFKNSSLETKVEI